MPNRKVQRKNRPARRAPAPPRRRIVRRRPATRAPPRRMRIRQRPRGANARTTGQFPALYRATRPTGRMSTKNLPNGDIIIQDEEYLATINGKLNDDITAASRISSNILINPLGANFAGTKLANMAKNFERFKFLSLSIHYVPAGTVTSTGQLIGYYDLNPTTDPSTTDTRDNLYRNAAAHKNKVVFHALHDVNLPMPISTATNDFFLDASASTEADVRTTNQARFVLVQNVDSMYGTTTIGTLYIKYRCLLKNQQLSVGVASSAGLPTNARGLLSVIWENANRSSGSAFVVSTEGLSTATVNNQQVPVYKATSTSNFPDFLVSSVPNTTGNGFDYGVSGSDQFALFIRLDPVSSTAASLLPVDSYSGNLQGIANGPIAYTPFASSAQPALVDSALISLRSLFTTTLTGAEASAQIVSLTRDCDQLRADLTFQSKLLSVLMTREVERERATRPDERFSAYETDTDTDSDSESDMDCSSDDPDEEMRETFREIAEIADDIDGLMNGLVNVKIVRKTVPKRQNSGESSGHVTCD